MTIARPDNFVETYRLKAALPNLHELTGRANFSECTRFVLQQAIDVLDIQPEDVVVDVGCGDGWLLSQLDARISKGIGTAASNEEADRLMKAYSGRRNISFIQALANNLPLASQSATKVVCNSVFHFLHERSILLGAMDELIRIARPGALIFVGEVLDKDEQRSLKGNGFRAFCGRLAYLFKGNGGVSRFHLAERGWSFLRALFVRSSLFIVHPKKTICIESNLLIKYAKQRDVELIFMRRHIGLNEMAKQEESRTRVDYLFRKPTASHQ